LTQHAFDVDRYDHAARLASHLRGLRALPAGPGRWTVVVVGAGLTGIEVATELSARLSALSKAGPSASRPHVVLVDHQPYLGSDMGADARPFLERAMAELQIAVRTGVAVTEIRGDGVRLSSGEWIAAATTVWCAGMRANPLTASFPVERDRFGRVPVDACLRVVGVNGVFAAGDVACLRVDPTHDSVMSCQHSRPMGRFAGHNVVCDLLGLPMLPLQIDWYVTVLDLGGAGALYTEGWERKVIATGATAKHTKRTINCQRIYPPHHGTRAEILAAAAPVVQRRPQ
jgi:NADH dehydrogenase